MCIPLKSFGGMVVWADLKRLTVIKCLSDVLRNISQSTNGLTENDGHEDNGQLKLQDMKMTDQK